MQEIITDITQKMAEGMIKYNGKTDLNSPEYDEYCYYVAGLVGEGLTRLFNLSSTEEINDKDFKNSISMGKFL